MQSPGLKQSNLGKPKFAVVEAKEEEESNSIATSSEDEKKAASALATGDAKVSMLNPPLLNTRNLRIQQTQRSSDIPLKKIEVGSASRTLAKERSPDHSWAAQSKSKNNQSPERQ